jgi:hypothetical protein
MYDRHVSITSPVELHGTLGLAELTRFQYFHILRRSWPLVVVVLIFIVPILASAAIANPDPNARAMLTNVTPLLLLLLFYTLSIGVMPYRNARKQLTAQSYLREPITYIFTSETISCSGTNASWSMAWNILQKLRETKSLFVLYHGLNLAVIVPKRFFQNAAEMEKWRQLVLGCVAPKRIEKPGLIGRWC